MERLGAEVSAFASAVLDVGSAEGAAPAIQHSKANPMEFRQGPDKLAGLVGAEYVSNPYSGVIYGSQAKLSDRIKPFWWDGAALCLMASKQETDRTSGQVPSRRNATDGGAFGRLA